MGKRNSKKRKIEYILLILIVALIAAVCVLTWTLKSQGKLDGGSSGADTIAEEAGKISSAADDVAEGHTVTARVFFASDFQAESGWPAPAETLAAIMGKMAEDGRAPDGVVICGDYTNHRKLNSYQLSPESSIQEIKDTVAEVFGAMDDGKMIFVQGNHDKLTESISETGLHEYDDYLVYVLNTQNDFPWIQGRKKSSEGKVRTAADEMRKCFDELIEKEEKRPVFIAGHVPIHFTARTSSKHDTGDNMYAGYIFEAVNEAAQSLDIVYITGHNHSKGWDCYLGGSSRFSAPGDTILIPAVESSKEYTDRYTEETLNFTYMNAGYVGYYMNCGTAEVDNGTAGRYAAADGTLTGTICEITQDELLIYRYSADGVHPLRWDGEADPYKGGIDTGLIPEKYYAKKLESPQRIDRKHAEK